MRGFNPRVRGWRGEGRNYIRGLGETTFGAAVSLPADEDLDKNVWVRWAKQDPDGSKEFWRRLQTFAKNGKPGGYALEVGKMLLEERKGEATIADMEAAIM